MSLICSLILNLVTIEKFLLKGLFMVELMKAIN